MAGTISLAARREVTAAVAERYRAAGRREKGRILDELCATTGWHRKHAVRVLRAKAKPIGEPKPRKRRYGAQGRAGCALGGLRSGLRQASEPMIPVLLPALSRHGRLTPTREDRAQLLEVSAATIDRMLVDVKVATAGGRRRRVGFYSAIRREVPIRTFNDRGIKARAGKDWVWSMTVVDRAVNVDAIASAPDELLRRSNRRGEPVASIATETALSRWHVRFLRRLANTASTAGCGSQKPQSDKYSSTHVFCRGPNDLGAKQQWSQGPGKERVHAVGHGGNDNEYCPQHNALCQMPRVGVQELRQERREEECSLRIQERHDKSISEDLRQGQIDLAVASCRNT